MYVLLMSFVCCDVLQKYHEFYWLVQDSEHRFIIVALSLAAGYKYN